MNPRRSHCAISSRKSGNSGQLASGPASISVANSTARADGPRSYHHAHAWRYSRAAVVHATVIAVATAAVIWAAVKARATATSDRNCQAGLCMVERCERHGLGGGNAEET
jgi:hypothetical protein